MVTLTRYCVICRRSGQIQFLGGDAYCQSCDALLRAAADAPLTVEAHRFLQRRAWKARPVWLVETQSGHAYIAAATKEEAALRVFASRGEDPARITAADPNEQLTIRFSDAPRGTPQRETRTLAAWLVDLAPDAFELARL